MSNIGKVEVPLAAPSRRAAQGRAEVLSTSLSALRSRFAVEDRGSVAITFALAFVPCMAMVGFAIDYGRLTIATQQTQAAFDAAALSGARAYQQAATNKMGKAIEARKAYWAAMFKSETGAARYAIQGSTVFTTPTLSNSSADITFGMSQWVRTPFMSVLEAFDGGFLNAGVKPNTDTVEVGAPADCVGKRWACRKISQSSTIKMKTSGASDGETLEISVMLDITGSMEDQPGAGWVGPTDPRSKLMMMKKAAKSFVNIILPDEDTTGQNRIALVPFGAGVYVGDTVAAAVTPTVPASCTRNVENCKNFVFTKTNNTSSNTTQYRTQNCVSVRIGAQANTDASYTSEASPALYDSDKFTSGARNGWGQCQAFDPNKPSRNMVMPLSGKPNDLTQAIDDLGYFGGTAGQIGTAWAWYMLSPNWKNLWNAANQPAAYGATVKKVAVLMTDGEYNTQFCKGVNTSTNISKSEAERSKTCTTPTSANHAKALCTGMKNKGITVYTVAFDVDAGPRELLKGCATSPSHAYYASDEASLMAAFEDIALRSSLVLVSR